LIASDDPATCAEYSVKHALIDTSGWKRIESELRMAVDQIIYLRTTLQYLGVPANEKSFMFGDNQSVVTNSTISHSYLNKRRNALAYHHVREMIAANILAYYWIDGKSNPQMLSVNIGAINRYGNCSSLYCFTLVIKRRGQLKTSCLYQLHKNQHNF
jgi:hypothetical protein